MSLSLVGVGSVFGGVMCVHESEVGVCCRV